VRDLRMAVCWASLSAAVFLVASLVLLVLSLGKPTAEVLEPEASEAAVAPGVPSATSLL
jgi:hypothetical protein